MKNLYYVVNSSTDPRFNLALEELLLTQKRENPIFMLWRNEPTVVIGLGQSAPDEVRLSAAAARGIHVVRRKTGGGAVYHDLGNVNFSFVYPYDAREPRSIRECAEPIVCALRTLGADAFFGGRNDILIHVPQSSASHKRDPVRSPAALSSQGTASARILTENAAKNETFKVCGTACRIAGKRILAHGCILFDTDLTVLGDILTPDKGKLARHGITSVRSRVTNLASVLPEMTAEEFMLHLGSLVINAAGSAERLALTPDDLARAARLMADYPYIQA